MKRILIGLLLLLPSVAPAATADLNQVIRTLESPFRADAAPKAAIHDFEADFSQESRIASLDRTQHGEGRVSIRFEPRDPARPSLAMFRWEYAQPTNQVVVSDGHRLWVYVPENRQVIESEIDLAEHTRNDDPLTFLTGLGNLSRDFSIGWADPKQDPQGNWLLALTPRRPAPLIASLRIVVDHRAVEAFKADGSTGRFLPLLATTVTDPSGNSTSIEFSNIRVNRNLSPASFEFIPPAGVTVVRPKEGKQGF